MRRLVLIIFCLEVGFVLIVVPWSAFWDRNYFAQLVPPVQAFITNNFVRGAVSGLGLINLLFGLAELVALFTTRETNRPPSIAPSHAARD